MGDDVGGRSGRTAGRDTVTGVAAKPPGVTTKTPGPSRAPAEHAPPADAVGAYVAIAAGAYVAMAAGCYTHAPPPPDAEPGPLSPPTPDAVPAPMTSPPDVAPAPMTPPPDVPSPMTPPEGSLAIRAPRPPGYAPPPWRLKEARRENLSPESKRQRAEGFRNASIDNELRRVNRDIAAQMAKFRAVEIAAVDEADDAT